jgi:methylamine--corrinoid protein Co-methyltransferase
MTTLRNLWDIWKRAETGPLCPERKFDTEILWPKAKEVVKNYDIKYDPENPIPTDTTLMDDVYKAGYELLLDVGVYCIDTEKIIHFEEYEIKEAIRSLQRKITYGEGRDAYTAVRRKLEDKRPPTVHYGPGASPISEKYALKIYQSYTKEPLIDSLYNGTLSTVDGVLIKPGSPWEMHAEIVNVFLMRQATSSAGKPGMAISGTTAVTAAADVGASSPEIGYRKTESREAKLKPQLKVDYDNLMRVANYMDYGSFGGGAAAAYGGGGAAYMYSLAGGPETSVCIAVASGLAGVVLMGANQMGAWAYNALYTGTSDRASTWATSLGQAAATRNTFSVINGPAPYITYAGPCTEMSLLEIATVALARTVVGCHLSAGCGGRQGIHEDYCSGMEGRWAAEVGHASAGMKLQDINEIVKTLLSRYEETILARNPPIGKKFDEMYDLQKLIPSNEYYELYNNAKQELQELGIDFEKINP